MKWIKFTKDTKLEVNDILFMNTGELAVVGSGVTTGEPTCINSLPEEWSFDFYEPGNTGKITPTGILKNIYGEKVGKIELVLKLKRPW